MEPPARVSVIATLTALAGGTAPGTLAAATELAARSAALGADGLELRADLLGDLDPEPLRRAFPGKLLYTLRSRAEGGLFDGSAERCRRRLLEAAAAGYDFVDLEAARDLQPELLAEIAPGRRLLSWHGPATDLDGLTACFEKMASTEAALYKLVPAAVQPGEELAPLQLLKALARRDVIAFATGPAGAWTRLVAPYLGAAVVYAAAGEAPGAPGQPALAALRDDYGLPSLPPVEALFGVVGNPVVHSLSPRIHNAGYRELGLPALYLPFHAETFGDFWLEVVESGVLEALGMPLRGLSVTAPFKEAALAVSGAESPLASRIGAANTLVWNQGVWEAESTDPDGVVAPLRARGIAVAGMAAAVIGAGGGGRSAAVGLALAGARVTLVNRGVERGALAAGQLGLPFLPLSELDAGAFDLLVNATTLGRSAADPLPLPPASLDRLRRGMVVLDLVYLDRPTPLLAAAASRGAIVIDGREVLLGQALAQFRMMTGRELPVDLARRRLGLAVPAGVPG
ncbi:MAG TPA: type I 3-dehydroquinate dehydratase [Thermoanaerobaculia bacterium]|nr:type I 3-dehydroquinate dehydratase [Thermoanaerobaculia bacterium]